MAVEFEWRIDGDGSEQTSPDSPKRRRWNWRLWLLTGGALALVIALAFFLWRRERLRALTKLERAVQEVARLEVRALADGDTELYLSLLDSADAQWYAAQQARVLAGVPLPPPVPGLSATLPLTIEHPVVVGDRARVEFVRLAGPPDSDPLRFRGVAFYRLASDGRWVHTSADPEYAGRVLVWAGPRNRLSGYIGHTELMEQLATELEVSADAFCTLLSCAPDLRFTLFLTDTLSRIGPAPGTVLPAPHLVGMPEGDAARAVWMQALKSMMVDRMLEQVVGEPTGGLVGAALRARARQYLGVESPAQPDPAALGEALSQGQLPALAQLWEGAVPEEQRALASDEAAVLVNFIEQQYGQEGVVRLLRALAGISSLDVLLPAILETNTASFEQQWLDYLSREITQQTP